MSKKRVLVVDDEPDLRMLMRLYLSMADAYEMTEATTGEEALQAADRHAFDLILMDIRMPGIGGVEACRRLKARQDTRDIPVIFVSAWAADRDRIAAREAGGVEFLPKPFDLKQLLQVVAQYA